MKVADGLVDPDRSYLSVGVDSAFARNSLSYLIESMSMVLELANQKE